VSFARNTLLYWLCDVEGIDGVTAGRIVAIDRMGWRGVNVDEQFPGLGDRIRAAYEGLAEVQGDL